MRKEEMEWIRNIVKENPAEEDTIGLLYAIAYLAKRIGKNEMAERTKFMADEYLKNRN